MAVQKGKLGAVILDVDGVIWIAGAPGDRSREFLNHLLKWDVPFCLLTNSCAVSKAERYATLTEAGFKFNPDQLITASEVTRDWLQETGTRSLMYLGVPAVLSDLRGDILVRDSGPVDAVVVGDLFDFYDRWTIDRAVSAIAVGAQLVAMQCTRRWFDGKDWYVDNGFWVAGLEYVTGRQAIVMGKPNARAYLSALRYLGEESQDRSATVFVSDDIDVDLKGAKDVGLTTIYLGALRELPPWVDIGVQDLMGLQSFLIIEGYND